MVSNRHYEVDLLSLEIDQVAAPSLEGLIRLVELPNQPTPFGNKLKWGKFVIEGEESWLFDRRMSEFNYQEFGYNGKVYEFSVQLSFDTSIPLELIDPTRFLYSLSRNFSQKNWQSRHHSGGAYFRLGRLGEGSIKGDIYAGVVAVGALVASYPDLKEGFRQMLSDTQFVAEQITTALRAAKLPEPPNEEGDDNNLDVWIREEPRRRAPPKKRIHMRRND